MMEVAVVKRVCTGPFWEWDSGQSILVERFMFRGLDVPTARDAAETAWRLTRRGDASASGGMAPPWRAHAEAYQAAGWGPLDDGDLVVVTSGAEPESGVAFVRERSGWRASDSVPFRVRGLPADLPPFVLCEFRLDEDPASHPLLLLMPRMSGDQV